MSIKLMSHVWAESGQRGGALIVLLAIADFANDDGQAYPSIKTLADKSRLSESQVHRILRELQSSQELEIEKNTGPHRANIYRVSLREGVILLGCRPCDSEGSARGTQSVSRTVIKRTTNRTVNL